MADSEVRELLVQPAEGVAAVVSIDMARVSERRQLLGWCQRLGIEAIARSDDVEERLRAWGRPCLRVTERAPSEEDYASLVALPGTFTLFLLRQRSVLPRASGVDLLPVCFDYLRRPFGAWELFWRVRCSLRHLSALEVSPRPASRGGVLICGTVRYDPLRREARAGNRRLELRHAEREVLAYLLCNAHRRVTAAELMKEVLHSSGDGSAARNQVYELRRKLRAAGVADLILTEGRQGYRVHSPAAPTTELEPSSRGRLGEG